MMLDLYEFAEALYRVSQLKMHNIGIYVNTRSLPSQKAIDAINVRRFRNCNGKIGEFYCRHVRRRLFPKREQRLIDEANKLECNLTNEWRAEAIRQAARYLEK